MTTRTTRIAALTLAAGLALGLAGAVGSPTTALAQPGEATAEPQFPVVDINFPGGSLGDYFDLVSGEAAANIVATDDVRALEMPAVRLRGVSADAAVQFIGSLFVDAEGVPTLRVVPVRDENALANSGLLTNPVRPGSQEEAIAQQLRQYEARRVQVYVVSARARVSTPSSPALNDVFSLGDVLRPSSEEPVDLQVERIFEMIESAMRLTADENGKIVEPELAYHDDTQMLVFRGSHEQHRMIEAILERYNNSWRPISARAESLRAQIVDLSLDAETTRIEASAAASQVEQLRRSVADARAMVDAGAMSQSEFSERSMRLADVEAQAQIMQARAEHAHHRLTECREALDAITRDSATSSVDYDFRGLGARGDRAGQMFMQFLQAADFPGTSMTADGTGTVTLTAQPPLHETLRYLLSHLRQTQRPGQ